MKSIFELLEENSSKNLISAVFMTYGFEADLFEHYVLPTIFNVDADFYENERRFRAKIAESLLKIPVTVLVDGAGYKGGKTFLYDLINVGNCTFHPKCFLLLYQDCLRIIIGSTNITKPGMCYNAELLWQYDLFEGDNTRIGLDLKKIIGGIQEYVNNTTNPAFKLINEFLTNFPEKEMQNECTLHSTLDKVSFSDKLVELVNNKRTKIKSLRILSPFYESDNGKTLESSMMGRIFLGLHSYMKSSTKVEFCFPGYRVNDCNKWNVEAPLELFKKLSESIPMLQLYVVPNLWKEDDGEEHPRNLHAKLIEVLFDSGDYLYMVGSPNFTMAAMNSKKDGLKNIEIGVFQFLKKRLGYPFIEKVKFNDLNSNVREVGTEDKPVIFIQKVELNIFQDKKQQLKIIVDVAKAVYPFTIVYEDKEIYKSSEKESEIIIKDFKLGRYKDLVFNYDDKTFTISIDVLQKYLIANDDMGFDFEPGINDILSYYSGRYRSLEEAAIAGRTTDGNNPSNLIIEGFRTNLNIFFKALDGMKQSLEKPSWSEDAFRYELYSPLGISKLSELFKNGYLEGNLAAEEAFFYILETAVNIKNLEFQPDKLKEEDKRIILSDTFEGLIDTLKSIYESASINVKRQYDLILKEYGFRGFK